MMSGVQFAPIVTPMSIACAWLGGWLGRRSAAGRAQRADARVPVDAGRCRRCRRHAESGARLKDRDRHPYAQWPGAGAIPVILTSSNPAVAWFVDSLGTAIGSITIPYGVSAATVRIFTSAVAANTSVTISAEANGIRKQTLLSVRTINVASFTLSPNPATGGSNVVGTLTLEGSATPGDIVVSLTSGNTTLAHFVDTTGTPINNVTVPYGATAASFIVRTAAVAALTTVTIHASTPGASKSVTLSITS